MKNGVLYTAKRTMITKKFVVSFIVILLGLVIFIAGIASLKYGPYILFLGLILMVIAGVFALCEALVMRSNTIDFYEKKYVIRSGIINKHENEALLTNLVSVSISQGLGGSMFDYGTVHINIIGKHDISLKGVKHPHELKKYIEGLMEKTDINKVQQVIYE